MAGIFKAYDIRGRIPDEINEEIAFKFPKILDIEMGEDEEETIMEACGELANILTAQFKNELTKFGYNNLTIFPIYSKHIIWIQIYETTT